MTAAHLDVSSPDTTVDPALLAEFNAGTRAAVLANRDREAREKELDRLQLARWIRDGLIDHGTVAG